MSHIKISSPFFSKLNHQEGTVGTANTLIFEAVNPGEKRILLIIQNKSSDVVSVILSSDPSITTGINIQPNQLVSFDNYNGALQCKSTGENSTIHVAIANV